MKITQSINVLRFQKLVSVFCFN